MTVIVGRLSSLVVPEFYPSETVYLGNIAHLSILMYGWIYSTVETICYVEDYVRNK